MTTRRVLFHVQHLLGIGHWRRAMLIARAMAEAGLEVTVLSGGPSEPDGGAPCGTIVQLPAARAADAQFKTILGDGGLPIDESFRSRRRDLVLATLAQVQPHVVIVEAYPFGRRAFRFELEPLIAAARAMAVRPVILASVRDVLVARDDQKRTAEIVTLVRRDFDRILVHGDPDLIPLQASFPGAAEIADRLHYTGYVTDDATPATEDDAAAGHGEVIVSAGGGAVGAGLFAAALAARPLSPLAAAPWRLLTGPHLPSADFATLAAARAPGVTVERFRPNLPALLRRCILSISQAGYNTTLDILAARARAIVVPFAVGRETEQAMRAALLARRGALHVVDEAALNGARLARAISTAMAAPPPVSPDLRRDGAKKTAEFAANCRYFVDR